MITSRVSYLRGSIVILALISFTCLVGDVGATTFYPDVMGSNVLFSDISENTSTAGDPEPLYGSPTVFVGDILDFNPDNYNFAAISNDGLVDTTYGAVSLTIEAKPGHTLDSVRIDESGSVSLFTISQGDPFASVTGMVELTILEIDNTSIVPLNLPGVFPTFTPSGGDYQHSVDATGPQFDSGWQGATSFDLAGELTSRAISYTDGVTKLTLRIDNHLLAAASAGSLASIDKNEFFISTGIGEINGVPEPSTLGLATLALLATIQAKRRQRLVAS